LVIFISSINIWFQIVIPNKIKDEEDEEEDYFTESESEDDELEDCEVEEQEEVTKEDQVYCIPSIIDLKDAFS
jgi:hypothetical protein